MARHNPGLPHFGLRADDGDRRDGRRRHVLRRARAADSDRYAKYETTLAELYLTKARELQGHAQYGEARALASEALRLANAANRRAAEHRSGDAATSTAGLAVPKE